MVFVAVVAVAFISLGRWQLDRLHQRQERNAATAAQEAAPPITVEEAYAATVTDPQQWRRVQLSGRFDPAITLTARQQRVDGVDGVDVLGVLVLDDGRRLLVDRGFLPAEGGRAPTVLPPPPAGRVSGLGWVRRNEIGRPGQLRPVENSVRLVDTPSIAAGLGTDLMPQGWAALISLEPTDDAGLRAVGPPALTEGNHFSYALQWFAFTGIAAIGAVVLVRGDLRERRLARAEDAESAGA